MEGGEVSDNALSENHVINVAACLPALGQHRPPPFLLSSFTHG